MQTLAKQLGLREPRFAKEMGRTAEEVEAILLDVFDQFQASTRAQ